MMIKTTYILSMSLWIFLSGCSSDGISDKTFIKCEDSKRGDVCTQEYKPVCATSVDKSKISYKTISNGCTACLDYQVTGFTKGECETEGKVWSDKSTKVDINSYIDLPDPTKRKSSVSFLKMDLSEEQIDLLKNIKFFHKTAINCDQSQDQPIYTIIVTDKDGIAKNYRSNANSCNLENGTKLISFDDAKKIVKLLK